MDVPSQLIRKGDGSKETFADNGHSDAEEEQIGASNNLLINCLLSIYKQFFLAEKHPV